MEWLPEEIHTQAHKCGFSVLIGILTGADVYVLIPLLELKSSGRPLSLQLTACGFVCEMCESWWREGIRELHVVWVRTSNLGQRLTVENASHIMAWIKRRHMYATNYCVYGIYLAACSAKFGRLHTLNWQQEYMENVLKKKAPNNWKCDEKMSSNILLITAALRYFCCIVT